jgi:hypothetical protein
LSRPIIGYLRSESHQSNGIMVCRNHQRVLQQNRPSVNAYVVNYTTAIFRQVNMDNPQTHHDALEFPDGHVALLTDVFADQQATVLQLPAQPLPATEAADEERAAQAG